MRSMYFRLLHVFSSTIHAKAAKCLQGYSQSKTSFTFSFNQVRKTMHRNSFNASFRHTSVFRGLSFSFDDYGSDLLVNKDSPVLPRLHTKQDISHFFLLLVSQDSAQELFRLIISSHLGVSRIEFQFCCVLTRFVSNTDYNMYSTFLTTSSGSVLFSRSNLLKRKDLCFSCQARPYKAS